MFIIGIAASLYLNLGLGLDVDPQHESFIENGKTVAEWPFLKPGPLGSVTAGIQDGPFYIELNHTSSITDGFRGAGLTWVEVGLRFNWELR